MAKKALSQLDKEEIIQELTTYGATFNNKWTVIELRAILASKRKEPTNVDDKKIKGLSKMTINQLRSQCGQKDIAFDMKETKGDLMIKLRAYQEQNPDLPTAVTSEDMIQFGKHKGKTYATTLITDPNYCDWVTATNIEEPQVSASLRRFALWLSGSLDQPTPKEPTPKEPTPKAPAPSGNVGAASSSAGSGQMPASSTATTAAAAKEAPKTSGMRRQEDDTRMVSEISKEAKEEMTLLKMRMSEIAMAHGTTEECHSTRHGRGGRSYCRCHTMEALANKGKGTQA